MLDPLIPDLEQESDAQRIARETSGAALDASTPDAGKTVVAVRVAQLRKARQILVIAPLGTRLAWRDTMQRMGLDLPFYWVRSTKDGPAAMIRLQFGEEGMFFIGPEYATQLGWDMAINKKTGEPIRTDKGKVIWQKNKFWN